jgi:hypothetical protein
MTTQPKWSTSNRKAYLVKLFLDSGGFCVYGHKACDIPEHHYELYIERLIGNWQADDRAQASIDWEAERKAIHSLGERRYPITGRFNNISMDIFHDQQPLYYFEGLGISGLTLQPFARVRLANSYFRLYIDLGDSLRGTSKNKRRKAIRYGKALPEEAKGIIARLVWLAVRDYLNH